MRRNPSSTKTLMTKVLGQSLLDPMGLDACKPRRNPQAEHGVVRAVFICQVQIPTLYFEANNPEPKLFGSVRFAVGTVPACPLAYHGKGLPRVSTCVSSLDRPLQPVCTSSLCRELTPVFQYWQEVADKYSSSLMLRCERSKIRLLHCFPELPGRTKPRCPQR